MDQNPPLAPPTLPVQVKTAKPHLKQLQQCVQSLSSQPDEEAGPVLTSDLSGMRELTADSFRWMTRSHAYITVYLVGRVRGTGRLWAL